MQDSSSPTAVAPVAEIVTADSGGVGKTTLAVQLATAHRLAGAPLDLYQLDAKDKLGAKTGLPVTSLTVAEARAESGDLSPADVIAPWYRAATSMPNSGRSVLLEVGGANAPLFHAGIADLDLQEDIETLGLAVVAFIVIVAGEESAKQMLKEIARFETNLPGAKVVIVRNQMRGCPLAATEYLDDELKRAFLAALESHASIRMPRVRPRSMAIYERLHVTPDTIVGWHVENYAEAIRQTGRPRDEAKIFVKDVAAWSGVVQDELLRVLPVLAGGDDA